MKKAIYLCILLGMLMPTMLAQPPQALKYKGIAKDQWGLPVSRKSITLRFTLYQGSENGTVVYKETHQTTTTLLGLVDVNIGEGTPQSGSFSSINWGAGNYYIKIELDPKGGTNFILQDESQQLLSVPYALFAGNVQNNKDDDADPHNEMISDIYLSGTFLYIVEGGLTTVVDLAGLQDGMVDADADPENELQDLSLNGIELSLTQDASSVDLNKFLDNTDNQQLILEGQNLTIQNGNTVVLTDNVNDADHDPTNEIQVLSLVGNLLTLTTNGIPIQIDLAPYLDNTDNQTLLLNDHHLMLTNGNSIQLPDSVNDADHDPLNELQELALNGTELSISGKNTVDLAVLQDGVNDGDFDPANELQILSIGHDTIYLSRGGYVKLPTITTSGGQYFYLDGDGDGYGNRFEPVWVPVGVPEPENFITNPTDCNDENILVNPSINEIIGDGIDNNCNGLIDEQDDDTDMDEDGFTEDEGDCNDSDATIHPGSIEICGDGIDQNCDGKDAVCGDNDGDGYTVAAGDCNDNNAFVHPGAYERCDGMDNNCNGAIDEGLLESYYRDADEDGFGDPGVSKQFCDDVEPGYVEDNHDCNDNDPEIHPGAEEICGDGVDQDCNGSDLSCSVFTDDDGDGFSEKSGDCNDTDLSIFPGATDICGDSIDQDCNGQDLSCSTISDDDGDGYSEANGDCNDTDPGIYPGATEIYGDDIDQNCNGIDAGYDDMDEDGYRVSDGDCDDNNAAIYPGATEECNNTDDDCDGIIDNNVELTTWYHDADGDGYGDRWDYLEACSAPNGYVSSPNDCNDSNSGIYPGAIDVCGDGMDQDCNGGDLECDSPDIDNDGDGYTENQGDCDDTDASIFPGASEIFNDGIDQNCDGADEIFDMDNDGFTVEAGDCDDNNDLINPIAIDICDGIDNNCNGIYDEDILFTHYQDSDGDGFGNPEASQQSCEEVIAGYVLNSDDCDDNNSMIHPGAVEICEDGIDQNCDGSDLSCAELSDNDGDGFSEMDGDCNDTDPLIHPGATETCDDGIDQDCNGSIVCPYENGYGELLYNEITILESTLIENSPSLHQLNLVCEEDFDINRFTLPERTLYNSGNQTGTTMIPETVGLSVLMRYVNASLMATEGEIQYTSGWSGNIFDFLVTFYNKIVGIEVVRASSDLSISSCEDLLNKNLYNIIEAQNAIDPGYKLAKGLLLILTPSESNLNNLKIAFNNLDLPDTIVLIVVTEGEKNGIIYE